MAQFEGSIRSSFRLLIWPSKTPAKCQFHAWLAIENRCLTGDNLEKCEWPNSTFCLLCQIHYESALHLFAQCSYSRSIWCRTFAHFDLSNIAAPAAYELSLQNWWLNCVTNVPKATKQKKNLLHHHRCLVASGN
jgi:hypothetical protein